MKIFVAGATGVIGSRLVPLLVKAGHRVTGTTRSAGKASSVERQGASAVVVDVFDAEALASAVAAAGPDVVIHQLTDLPDVADPAAMAESRARNSRLRIVGTRNLMQAASAARVKRVVAQSIAFAYAPGPLPHGEGDPIDVAGQARMSGEGVIGLEGAVTGTPGIDGIVLRYGRLVRTGHMERERAATAGAACRCGGARRLACGRARRARHLQCRGRRWRGFDREGARRIGLRSRVQDFVLNGLLRKREPRSP